MKTLVCRCGLPLMALALFTILGGHWLVLQGVAWSQMMRDYRLSEGSLRAAVVKTFSGEAPCDLCERITEGRRQQEQQPATLQLQMKFEMLALATLPCAPTPRVGARTYPTDPQGRLPRLTQEPPLPVPRHLA